MIIAFHRKKVISNIKKHVINKEFHAQAEIADPILSKDESQKIVAKLWENKKKRSYKIINSIINPIFDLIALILPKDTYIDCQYNNLPTSAFVTCNHYNQLDILPIKRLALKKHKRLYFIVKDTNLVMHFPIGFLVRHADCIPLTYNNHYLGRELPKRLNKVLHANNWILIYPEQELWFNYRKPRPLAKGAYYYAAKLNAPIISCFAEIKTKKTKELFHHNFYKTKVILHVLNTIYPDSSLTVSQNTKIMMKKDFEQKKKAYEKAYNKKLSYDFSYDDIAGYTKKIDKNF